MGAWGTGPFENDEALDWIGDAPAGDLEYVRSALAAAAEPDGSYLDASDGNLVLAAAEVVAALRGAPAEGLPDSVTEWVETLPRELDETLLGQARAATDRVITEPSELLELWDEAEPPDATAWKAGVADLRQRLG